MYCQPNLAQPPWTLAYLIATLDTKTTVNSVNGQFNNFTTIA